MDSRRKTRNTRSISEEARAQRLSTLRSSTKRRLSGPRTGISRPNKRRTSKFAPFPLMQLPTEVRLLILRELLWQHTAICKPFESPSGSQYLNRSLYVDQVAFAQKRSFQFWPAILRACRQLLVEGEPILYTNTFACYMWYEFSFQAEDAYRSAFFSPHYDFLHSLRGTAGHVPQMVLRKAKNVELTVRASSDVPLLNVRKAVRDFIRSSRFMPRLQHLTVDLQITRDEDTSEDADEDFSGAICEHGLSKQEYQDLAVGPLVSLRYLRSACIKGVSPKVATELVSKMTSMVYVDELPVMFDRLLKYVHQHVPDYIHCGTCLVSHNYLAYAYQAMDLNDSQMFRHVRREILSLIDKHNALERADLLLHDAVPDDSQESTYQPAYNKYGKPDNCGHIPWHEDSDNDPDLDNEDEYEDIEPVHIKNARELREKQVPALVKLHEIWRVEGGYDENFF